MDNSFAGSLESVSPTLTYYSGSGVNGSGTSAAPTSAGTYTVVASFAGSTDYASADLAGHLHHHQGHADRVGHGCRRRLQWLSLPGQCLRLRRERLGLRNAGRDCVVFDLLLRQQRQRYFLIAGAIRRRHLHRGGVLPGQYRLRNGQFPGDVFHHQHQVRDFPGEQVLAGSPFIMMVTAENTAGAVNTSFSGSITLSLINNPGGTSLTGTLTETAVGGQATFSDLVLGHVGVGYQIRAQGTMTGAVNTTISIPFTVSPADPMLHTAMPTAPAAAAVVSPGHPIQPTIVNDEPVNLTYTALVGGYTQLFSIEEQFGLEPEVQPMSLGQLGTSNFNVNQHGAQELNLVSVTGGNLAHGNAYFILPNGNLYAYDGNSIITSETTGFVASLGQASTLSRNCSSTRRAFRTCRSLPASKPTSTSVLQPTIRTITSTPIHRAMASTMMKSTC